MAAGLLATTIVTGEAGDKQQTGKLQEMVKERSRDRKPQAERQARGRERQAAGREVLRETSSI